MVLVYQGRAASVSFLASHQSPFTVLRIILEKQGTIGYPSLPKVLGFLDLLEPNI
jgi:hypothetical protein